MTRRSIVLGALIALPALAAAQAQEASFPSLEEPEVVPGQFIVKLSPGVEAAGVDLRALGPQVEVIETLPLTNLQIVTIADGAPTLEAVSARAEDIPGIAYIEPVYVVRIDQAREPDDARYREQWGFPKISAPLGWSRRTDSSDVVVAVIDTGVDYTHPDLGGNVWRNPGETPGNGVDDDGNGIIDDVHGANFFPTTPTGDPMDDHGHGTHVAGTVGAVTDNAAGVAGTSWTASIMGVKFLGANGSGSTAGAIRAIEYAIGMEADIMNNSWGGGGFSRALQETIQLANDRGILFVAAAGNNGRDNDTTPHYPSSYEVPNVLAVMATDEDDRRAGFSNVGATSVDVAAPGVNILSTVPGGGARSFNGTSMATPHVAGLAALVLAEEPSLSVTDLKARVLDTAEEIPGLSGMTVTGARINLARALGVDDGDEPEPGDPCEGDASARIAYGEFLLTGRKRVDGNTNLLSVSFELPEPMVVEVEANTSARRISGSGNTIVRTGFLDRPAENRMWTASYRRLSLADAGDNRPLVSSFGTVLPAGEHTMYWKLWISGATVQLDSGTMTVRAFPCSMGGSLSAGAAGATAILEADPSAR